MAKLSIVKMFKENYDYKGFCLRIPSEEITLDEFGSEWLKNYIYDMFETLYSHPSGVGLASNQVGVLKRVCVIDLKRDAKKPLVLINPVYESVNDNLTESREVCLSFPGVSSTVKRYSKIKVIYKDFYGEEHSLIAEGFKANVLQHEIDHLNGIVDIDLNEDLDHVNEHVDYCAQIARNAVDTVLKEGQDGY